MAYKCSFEEAITITLDDYIEKYINRNQTIGTNINKSTVEESHMIDNPGILPTEQKPYHIPKCNQKNYWINRKTHYRQKNSKQTRNNNFNNNNVAILNSRPRKTRWNPCQPYQQLLRKYNILTQHLPSLTDIRLDLPDLHNVSNYNNNSLVETTKPQQKASIDQLSTLADQLLKKFDTLYEIRQSIKVEQEKKDKYNISIQKEIATIQNKQLFVKCPNSEVVTSDGPGIDVKMTVHSTSLSQNMRFA